MSECNGFEVKVEHYCQHCPEFEANIETMRIDEFFNDDIRYLRTITCQHTEKCKAIYEQLRKEPKVDHSS